MVKLVDTLLLGGSAIGISVRIRVAAYMCILFEPCDSFEKLLNRNTKRHCQLGFEMECKGLA